MALTDLHLKDLVPDPRNARRHTPRNVGTIVDALQEVGAARSIVIDEDNVVLAGNATIEAAAEAGLVNVQVVEADGKTLIAVRRCYAMELEPAYVQVAIDRWEAFTGQKARKVDA